MNLEQAARAVERGWSANTMCVYKFGEHFAVAAKDTSREVELRDANFTTLVGAYRLTNETAYTAIARDI